jgi:hypothetical protein
MLRLSVLLSHSAKCLAMPQIYGQLHRDVVFLAWNLITMRRYHSPWRKRF